MGKTTNIGPAIWRRLGFRHIFRIRSALNRLTRGRVGLYSTAEHHSDGPGAKVLRYYQYDAGKEISCATCGWHGRGGEGAQNMFDELFDVRCPSCETMLLIVGFPTLAEIEAAAKHGNEEARRELELISHYRRSNVSA
ncbi:MAG: hypothetical protein WKF96_11760 [Solirubrobacteraceae bacterium]